MLENRFVEVQRIEIAAIPCLVIRARGCATPYPTVIYYHGWHSSKEQKRFEASILASHGCQVVVPDALHHGERDPIDHDDPEMLDRYFNQIILQTVTESPHLLAELVDHYGADAERIGVMGSSMGGFAASGVLATNPTVKCLVTFNGACAWIKAEEIFRELEHKPSPPDELVAKLALYDLWSNRDRLVERPILMLHGDSDTQVPIDIQRYFYTEVAPLYAQCPERLQLTEVPRMNHYVSTRMLAEAIEWFSRYL
ncbi:MAG: alpha/beta fold hydrolase [Bacillota bacterium]